MAGKTSLADLPGLLKRCALYIGNDSGPKHIAAAVGIPTIGIHSGVVDPVEWGPVGPNAVALRRNMTCSPCYLAKAEDCPRSLACLQFLEPNLVYETADLLLTPMRRVTRKVVQTEAPAYEGSTFEKAGTRMDNHVLEQAEPDTALTADPAKPVRRKSVPKPKVQAPASRRRRRMTDDSAARTGDGLAQRAGAEIQTIRARGFAVHRKADHSVVTEADHAAEAIILAGLRDALPGCTVIAEEEAAGGKITAATPEFWLVDPLDGTRDFTGGGDDFAVNIGLGARPAGLSLASLGFPRKARSLAASSAKGAWRLKDGTERTIAVRPVPAEGVTVVASRYHGDQARLDAFLGGRTVARVVNFRLQPEILPSGGRAGRPLSTLRPHDGMGHLRPSCGA